MGYSVAVIGTGANPDDPDVDGYAMAYRHAAAYERLDDCELVACADIVRENAEQFADRFGIPGHNVYESYETMLREVRPDVVSVCVPPAVHSGIVIDCATSGVVSAVHCEKPMASTWAECREMVSTCEEWGVQLTINHQRRLGLVFRKAKSLLDDGRIGDLRRVEIGGKNLYDYGTHLFDLSNFYVDQASAEWVLGQIDYREEDVQFGMHNENQALVQWQYENGVHGLASTGEPSLVDCHVRLVGTDGEIELGAADGSQLRMRRLDGSGWTTVGTKGDSVSGNQKSYLREGIRRLDDRLPLPVTLPGFVPNHLELAIEDVVHSLDGGTESALSGRNALDATELIFAAWESSRRRGRVDLPLDIDDNPLETMVEEGELTPLPPE